MDWSGVTDGKDNNIDCSIFYSWLFAGLYWKAGLFIVVADCFFTTMGVSILVSFYWSASVRGLPFCHLMVAESSIDDGIRMITSRRVLVDGSHD